MPKRSTEAKNLDDDEQKICHRRCNKQLQIAEAVRTIAAKEAEERKLEMEVEIEKGVKAQKEAQSCS